MLRLCWRNVRPVASFKICSKRDELSPTFSAIWSSVSSPTLASQMTLNANVIRGSIEARLLSASLARAYVVLMRSNSFQVSSKTNSAKCFCKKSFGAHHGGSPYSFLQLLGWDWG